MDDELACNFPESDFSCSTHPVFQDSLINETIRSLNVKQRQVFDVIHKWARDYVKNISMVSSMLFYRVHQRLNEMFGVSTDLPFTGLPVLACGDLYQLPPVKGAPIYSSTDNIKGYLSLELWNNFKVVKLTEVMRQRGDLELISFLNKI